MKERPILFTGPNVVEILGDRKTQTRRIVKPALRGDVDWALQSNGFFAVEEWNGVSGRLRRCPYGRGGSDLFGPGERLWVRETWGVVINKKSWTDCGWEYDWEFSAEKITAKPRKNSCQSIEYRAGPGGWGEFPEQEYWRPSIHMHRWASRITLEIVEVRVERLNNISYQDALAEGILRHEVDGCTVFTRPDDDHDYTSPIKAFAGLWEAINGEGSWEKNPWVWAITFKRLEQPNG